MNNLNVTHLRFAYIGKVLIDVIVICYLIFVSFNGFQINAIIYHVLCLIDLACSLLLVTHYAGSFKPNHLIYLASSFFSIYFLLRLIHDGSSNYVIQTIVIGALVPLGSYRYYQTIRNDLLAKLNNH